MNSSARGAFLVAAAVLLAFLILRGAADNTQGLGTTAAPVVAPTATPAVQVDPADVAALPTPDAIDPSLARANDQVTVLVANGTSVSNQASRLTSTLRNEGFVTREPRNADAQASSTIFYRPGFDSEAAVVQGLLGGSAPLANMPVPDPFIGEDIDLGPVDVLVLVGADELSTE